MNKRFFALILFSILLCLNTNAELSNPSFETSSGYYNTGALGWTNVHPANYCVSDYFNNCSANTFTSYMDVNRVVVGDANDGSAVLKISYFGGQASVLAVSDFNLGSLIQDTEICVSMRQTSGGSNYLRFFVYDEANDRFTTWGSFSSPLPNNASWTEFCRTYNVNDSGQFFAIGTRVGDGQGDWEIDNIIFPVPLTLDILNFTQSQTLVGETVTFKAKVLRTDLNQFITDANVELISSDFNAVMVYNSYSGYYETAYSFSQSDIGSYDFNVFVHDIGIDANLSNNSELFSINVTSPSTLIEQQENLTESEEYFISATSIKSIMQVVNSGENIIFMFDGNQTYAGINFDLNFVIRDSFLSAKRFFIYTANESEFVNGIWNFNDTLTFGSSIENGLQRIWNETEEWFEYSFQDKTIAGNQQKYYKLVYRFPYQYWDSLNPTFQSDSFKLNNWDLSLLPSVFISETGHKTDYFPVSTYNNIRNQLKEELPDINSNTDFQKFWLVFNAFSDSAFTIQVGSNDGGVTDSITNVPVLTTNTTFHVNSGAKYPLIKADSTSFKQLTLSDYAIIERGFFLKPLELRNQDGTIIEAELINGTSAKVIDEGIKFRVKTTLYNKDDSLSFLEAKVYFSTVDPNNQVAYFKKDLNFLSENEIYHLDWMVEGIIDLNGTTARDFIVVVKATNKDNDWFEIQTDTFKLRQFPNSTADLSINAFLQNKIVGEHLSGRIELRIKSPDILRGLKLYVYRIEEGVESGYIKTLWKDQDFTCSGFDCKFNFELLDQVFDGAGVWFFTLSTLLTTQLEDHNSLLSAKTYSFPVNFLEFETARILQVIERNPDHNYTNEEIIPLVLQLRNSDRANLKNDLKVKLFASDCGSNATGGSCTIQDINYSPDSFLYDLSTGYNYFFWNRIFIDEDGTLLDDLTFYRFTAVVESIKGSHNGEDRYLLTSKCKTESYGTDFFSNALSTLNHFLTGNCTVPPDLLVPVGDENELRLNIDTSISLTPPTQECSFCMNTDNNGNFINNLEQDLFCGTWYTFNSQRIDRFDFYLTNENSDLSKESSNAQYIKLPVPFELLSFNDLSLMRQSMAIEYGTEADTIGELLQQGFNYLFTGIANPISDIPEGLTASGLINNVGFDCNFSRPLDPTFIDGMIFYKIKGIKTINKQDMVILHPELTEVPPIDLLEFMNIENFPVPRNETVIEVYASDMVKVMNETVDSPLVVDVSLEETKLRNTDENQYLRTLPTTLRFNAIFDLFYNNELSSLRRIVPITITAVITGTVFDLTGFANSLISNPFKWMAENWWIIFIILVLILYVSVVIRNFSKGG